MSDAPTKETVARFPKGTYVCPECGERVQVFVAMTCAPECNRHSSGSKRMEVTK